MGSFIHGWQPIMPENGILVTEQSMTHVISVYLTSNIRLRFLLGARWGFREAWSNPSAGYIKPSHQYHLGPDCSKSNLKNTNKHSTCFFLKVIESGDWGLTTSRETTNENHFYQYIQPFVLVGRVFTRSPGDQGSIPGWAIPKTQRMVLDAALLNTKHYKVRIKGKVEQSREKNSAFPYTIV